MKKALEQHNGDLYIGTVNVIQKINQLKTLERWVKDALTEPLKSACGVLNWESGVLTLHVANAALATVLRYQLRELQKTLNVLPVFQALTTIRYRIVTEYYPTVTAASLSAQKPSCAHGAVYACIETLETGPLKEALQRLARHVEKT